MDATTGMIHSQYDSADQIAAARATIARLSQERAAQIRFANFLARIGSDAADLEVHLSSTDDSIIADVHFDLGNLLDDKGDAAGAEAEYRAAIALDPSHAEAHFKLGLLLANRHGLLETLVEISIISQVKF